MAGGGGRGRGRLEDEPEGDSEGRFRIPAQGASATVCGYQLLGGTTVPDLDRIYPIDDAGRAVVGQAEHVRHLQHRRAVRLRLYRDVDGLRRGQLSHSLIDDNVIYAYGCRYDANGKLQPRRARCAGVFLLPRRHLRHLRLPRSRRAAHRCAGRGDGDGPREDRCDHAGFCRRRRDVSSQRAAAGLLPAQIRIRPTACQDGAVYTYVGSENIYQPIAPFPMESSASVRGPAQAVGGQSSVGGIVQDRIHLAWPDSIAGGRPIRFAARPQLLASPQPAPACSPPLPTSCLAAAVRGYCSTREQPDLYGNYGVLLSLGPQAPWWVDNANQFLASVLHAAGGDRREVRPGRRILLTAALFHMRAPFFYPKRFGAGQLLSGETTGGHRGDCALSPRAARRMTASN